MPGFDKTGPEGQGPLTGRKTRRCTQENDTFTDELQPGRRFGRRFLNRFRMEEEPGNHRGRRGKSGRGRGRK